ncbi:hypothetical protein DFR70_102612 [Nocardia tenerifensis]|uniref:Uncharacterized protein n=1 Tax=Nocardia tenerifensis TaxID=228006 RepID=A0A318KBP9_9NOCA|nr:hypothetical protein [Nocardia tenerifensis]PXX68926.1 hypothetical protein DFR70_102612 [Nocardia tenerifensis]
MRVLVTGWPGSAPGVDPSRMRRVGDALTTADTPHGCVWGPKLRFGAVTEKLLGAPFAERAR